MSSHYTDASEVGSGAVLTQEIGGERSTARSQVVGFRKQMGIVDQPKENV